MATERRSDPRKKFVPRFLPWLLAAATFVVYWWTLNRWISLFNLGEVAKISGWTWQPEFLNPFLFLVTYPFRWLPAGQIPIALNLFSAVCAAATLGLLARSVAILPQDRTDAQRERERSDFSFLTIRSAWLPPVLAVAVCGLQMTFWEHATNYTGEMFDLLLFAFVIWSLLEYRLDEREGRLFLAAAVYGAGMADNWAMVGFFPLFVIAIVWTRRLSFFNMRFLRRMLWCGLAGMVFYFLLPLVAVAAHKMPVTFWQALKVNLLAQCHMVKLFFTNPEIRHSVGLLSLTSLLPIFLISIRWTSSFGDNSKLGLALTSFMFHLFHAIILGVCIWVAFDPPFSPRHLGLGLHFLTFYYLAALGIGYFSGYFLLVFGQWVAINRSQRLEPSSLDFLNLPIFCGVWLVAILAISGLIYKNTPQILETNGDTVKKFALLMEQNLPQTGGFLLSDDPWRLFIVHAALARDGRAKNFVPVETASLSFPDYHRFLHQKFPQWPDTISAVEQTNGISPLHLLALLATLAKTNELYYLHPSYGYYFEEFYLEPHGLVYKLKTLPNNTLLPPSPDQDQIDENETFWAQAEKKSLAAIEKSLMPSEPNATKSFGEKLLAQLHIGFETNENAAAMGIFYSRSLDFWGVALQRAGELDKAAAHFDTALKLNPDNAVAQINLQFNQTLRGGQRAPVDLSRTTLDQLGKPWNEILEEGPFDEPSFCLQDGALCGRAGLLRQAVAPLERVRELAPDNLVARSLLAQIYIRFRLPDRALDALREPLEHPEIFSLSPTNSTEFNVLAAAVYFQKNNLARGSQLLEVEISRHPTNDDLLMAAAQAYTIHGLFTNALAIIDNKLKLMPDDPNWLYNRGYIYMRLKNYDGAIIILNRVLSLQATNNLARFNRAVAYLQSDKLDAARTDYLQLQQTFTNSFQIDYGLGEIAWRQHETNDAIKYYQLYLGAANPKTAEATNVAQRLHELKK